MAEHDPNNPGPASSRIRASRARRVQYVADLVVLVAAFVFAYLLRFDFRVPVANFNYGAHQLPYVVIIQFAALLGTGTYSTLS